MLPLGLHQLGAYKKVQEDFFAGFEDVVIHDMGLSGQSVNSGVVVLGGAIRNERALDHLFHEMAHFIEIDLDRINKPNWGLRWGTSFRAQGKIYYKMAKWTAIKREIRGLVIQEALCKQYGIFLNRAARLAELSKQIDFMNVPGKSHEDKMETMRLYQDKCSLSSLNSLESIKAEWVNRIGFLRSLKTSQVRRVKNIAI